MSNNVHQLQNIRDGIATIIFDITQIEAEIGDVARTLGRHTDTLNKYPAGVALTQDYINIAKQFASELSPRTKAVTGINSRLQKIIAELRSSAQIVDSRSDKAADEESSQYIEIMQELNELPPKLPSLIFELKDRQTQVESFRSEMKQLCGDIPAIDSPHKRFARSYGRLCEQLTILNNLVEEIC